MWRNVSLPTRIAALLLLLYVNTSLLLLLKSPLSDKDNNLSSEYNSIFTKDVFFQQQQHQSSSFSNDKEKKDNNNIITEQNLVRHKIKSIQEKKDTSTTTQEVIKQKITSTTSTIKDRNRPVLTAYLEEIDQASWNIKPLPLRITAQSDKLQIVSYPSLNSCLNLHSQWPIDDDGESPPTAYDPFLPWIHDVFPNDDGTIIQFVSQNKRRCHTGKSYVDVKTHFQPQVSLFQHVPIKRKVINETTRYVLSSHEEADEDGIQTRFICRFKDSTNKIWETLSMFPFNYDYGAYRKNYPQAFTYEGFDNHIIWTSQHLFHCPVPTELQTVIKNGDSVVGDYATLFLDLVPIRTPPRYGDAKEFLPPWYGVLPNTFNASEEFGVEHVLPLIKDSGRLENIPICKPSLLTYRTDILQEQKPKEEKKEQEQHNEKNNTIIACTWAANNYKTRKSMTIGDGSRRLKEWLTFHLLAGFDHIYVYDNTHAFDKNQSLADVTSQFPSSQVTRINWPCKICNNRPMNLDDKGERSSQYAAESSCRLRFGGQAKWLASMDVDEYLIPMGKYNTIKELLFDLDNSGYKIFSFRSWRTRPVLSKLELPDQQKCYSGSKCFTTVVPNTTSFLDVYNCEQEPPHKKLNNAAEKQIYQPDYVLMHFVHYSTITTDLELSKDQTNKRPDLRWMQRFNDKKNRFFDEVNEATMMHTKTVPFEHTRDYEDVCKKGKSYFGFPWPDGKESNLTNKNHDGFHYSCFVNERVKDVWVPKLHMSLGIHTP